MIFCITFPQDHIFVDNWIEVESDNESTARKFAEKKFPRRWASIYRMKDFQSAYFPKGKIELTAIAEEE